MSTVPDPSSPAISRTCLYVAAGRALGAREPDPEARNPDYLAEKLLGDPETLDFENASVRALSRPYDEVVNDLNVISNIRMMTIRTRFIDEALARAIAAGATQVAILGAGLDTHAYRCQDLLATANVFEVDRPATQAFKKQRVQAVLGGPPANLTYVATDFQHETLPEVLARHGYDSGRQTFFILEGVTMYVPEAAARTTFQFVGAHPPGSAIVFDFVYRTLIDMVAGLDVANLPEAARPYVQRFLDLIRDEPWVFGLPPGGEREFLTEFGLGLREAFTIGGEESVKRYLTRADGTHVGGEAIARAMARMAQRRQAEGQPTPTPQMPPEQMRQQQRLMAYQMAEAVVAARPAP